MEVDDDLNDEIVHLTKVAAAPGVGGRRCYQTHRRCWAMTPNDETPTTFQARPCKLARGADAADRAAPMVRVALDTETGR